MKPLRFLLLLFLFAGCNSPRVFYDYDEQANFTQYRTYALYPGLQTSLSELDERRLIFSLSSELKAKGIFQVANPDILINVYSEEFREPSRNSIGIGVGGTGRNIGVGVSGGIPLGGPETFLSLTFDIIDAQRDELIWQAVVESKLNKDAIPEKRKSIFDKMVRKALEGYPPERTRN